MSKKKKEIYKEKTFLNAVDEAIDKQYKEIITDIEDIKYEIAKADRKKEKKMRKKRKNGKISFYSDPKSKKARVRAANKITKDEIFHTIKEIFEDLKPIIVVIARLLASLINAILSLSIVKERISAKTLSRLNYFRNACMNVK